MQADLAAKVLDEETLDLENYEEYFPIEVVEPIKVVEDKNYGRTVQLKGPSSPLETQVHSILLDSDQRSISIDPHSVNNVFLTPMQQVSTQNEPNRMTLRDCFIF